MTDRNKSEIFGKAVDVHGHLVPEYLFGEDPALLEAIGINIEVSEGSVFIIHDGDRLGPIKPGMSQTSKRLDWMDARGIAKQWISPWMDLFTWTSFSQDEIHKWFRLVNSSIAKSAKSSNGRLGALGVVHLADPERAASEISSQSGEFGWTGLMVNTHPHEVGTLGSSALFPFWERAEAMGMPVLLHPPTNGPSCHITPRLLQNITGRLIDTTLLVTDLILSGFMERFPKLKLIVVHGGGLLPYQSFRLDGLSRAGLMPEGSTGRPISQDLKKFFYDTVALDSLSIETLVKRVGVDRVLLGSDAPFPIADPDPLSSVLGAGLSGEDIADICCHNANRLALSEGSSDVHK